MSFSKFIMREKLCSALFAGLLIGSFSTSASATPYLYETFGGQNGEIAALNLGVTTEYNAHSGNIGSVVAGGGKVYWTEGKNLWSANGDLSNASILHVNGLAPNGLALDVPSGYLYETFGGQNGEIAALNLGVTTEFNAHSGNIGSVVAGGGKVYWTEGKNLWFANGDLSDASILHVNGLAPNGLALDVPSGYLYETFGGQNGEIASLNLAVTTEFSAHSGNIGSVVAGGRQGLLDRREEPLVCQW
ncbi:hypothetical protein [Undibacterium sp. Xuan67W]|uniref:hypothetical protein n=1 Tax=Undibacterium sp. Xuan67W TaxID=3413057 RepID=UPI003BF0958B